MEDQPMTECINEAVVYVATLVFFAVVVIVTLWAATRGKYHIPPGDLGLLASANRAMSEHLSGIRLALNGSLPVAGDIPECVRRIVSENDRLRSENKALLESFEQWRTDFKILLDELVALRDQLVQEREP
jgi:hypothetical protein